MKVAQHTVGRIFTLRLDDGEQLPSAIEQFAVEKNLMRGFCIFLGGVKQGGKLIVGPETEDEPPRPMTYQIEGAHEALGTGTIFPDQDGIPRLHAHAALGRSGRTSTGCIRKGIEAWKVLEIVLFELTGDRGVRVFDRKIGFSLLELEETPEAL